MKAVLISIQPKWCELIASGKKTIEVRKTRPKIETPFKVYVYMTKHKWIFKLLPFLKNRFAKVIGEFVCDRIDEIDGWHISELKIYDKPKELGEFYIWKKCNACRDTGYESTACMYDENCKVPAIITRPPQSWCYVEELE